MAWLLPETVATDYVCVNISIPNTPQDIRNFIGSVLTLAQWFNYERTGDNKASLVANTWLETLNGILIGGCMELRQSPESPCILQMSEDGGETWSDWADITLCVNSDYVESLISATPSLQSLIQSTVTGTPSTGGMTSRINSTAFESVSCDNDALYGYSKALWDYINANNIDALEIVAEATNASEQLSKVLTAILPGLELLPVDEVLGWIEAFGNYNLEAYEASITVGLEQEIICDLFCLSIDNGCTLDFGTVYEYLIDKMGGTTIPTATATLIEWIQFMVIGSYPNDRIVYLWSAFQLALAFMGQEFLGLSTLGRYALVAQAGDPDNDWELLCDDCGWTSVLNFTTDSYSSIVTVDAGVWVDGLGYNSVYEFASGENRKWISFDIDIDPSEIDNSVAVIQFQKGNVPAYANSYTAVASRIYDDPTLVSQDSKTYGEISSTLQEISLGAGSGSDIDILRVFARCSINANTGTAYVTSLTVTGTGTKPSQLP